MTLKKDPIFSITVPAKLQSYFACAKRIIAALDGEGSRLVKEAQAGLTCPAEDVHSLSQAILKMYNMPKKLREQMGKNGLQYFKANFDRDKLLLTLVDWMYEVCKRSTDNNKT